MAEGLLKLRLTERGLADSYQVRSAGIIAREGNVPPLDAVRAAGELRVDLSKHSATPLTSKLLADADLVVAMDRSNVEHILNLVPDLGTRLRLLKQYARGARGFDIPDPMGYPIEIFRESYQEIQEGIDGLVEALAPGHPQGAAGQDSSSAGRNPG
jgi:protein-tyrosine phosphatase